MIKDAIFSNKKRNTIFIIIFIIALLAGMVYDVRIDVIREKNGKMVEEKLAESSDMDREETDLSQLEGLLKLKYLDDDTKGKIYARLASNTLTKGDTLAYNRYVGYASFYFKKAKDYENYVELYSKYIGKMYENGGFSVAVSMLQNVETVGNVSRLEKKGIVARFYLGYADTLEMLADDDGVQEKLTLAKNALDAMSASEKGYAILYAKYEMLLARSCIQEGDIVQARIILAEYSEEDLFGFDEGSKYLKLDYLLPYYELNAKLCYEAGDREQGNVYLEKYIAICEEANFFTMN